MAINVRAKGQRAERAAIAVLQPVVTMVYREAGYTEEKIPSLERNLMQSMKGGFDIVGLDWLALEIKHQETLNISSWWDQTKRQCRDGQTPVLMFKKNNSRWQVMTLGYIPVADFRIKTNVIISLEAFILWFEHRLKEELKK